MRDHRDVRPSILRSLGPSFDVIIGLDIKRFVDDPELFYGRELWLWIPNWLYFKPFIVFWLILMVGDVLDGGRELSWSDN